jgi:5-methylcytosine-specific restriction endonuclease McrA
MADAHSTHTCEVCGSLFIRKLNKNGTQRKTKHTVCSNTCYALKANGKYRIPLRAGERACTSCGTLFIAKANQKHCSGKCRNGTTMTRGQYRESVKAASKNNFVCINCGKPAYRRLSGTNKKRGHENKYCSRECLKSFYAKARDDAERLIHSVRRLVSKEIKAIRSLGKSKYKPTKKRCFCGKCGAMYIASLGGGLHKQFCDACREETKKSAKRVAKAARRARKKGAEYEPVNPLKVFERDGWRCQLCGVKTPKTKRGTYSDQAPELDHIIPLSAGGSHSYLNTQCACRRCNQEKSDKPMGQLLLIG